MITEKEKVGVNCPIPVPYKDIVFLDTKPTVVFDVDGNVWVAWSAKNYENLSVNLSRIADGWEARNKSITYLKECILRSREKLGE